MNELNHSHIVSKRFKVSTFIVAMGFDFILSSNRLCSSVKTTPSRGPADSEIDSSKRTRSWSAFTQPCNVVRRPIIT